MDRERSSLSFSSMSSPKLTTTMTIRFVLLEHQYRETIKLCKYASYFVLSLCFYWHPVSNISLIKDAPNRKANDNETDFYWTTVVNQKFPTNNFQFTQRPHKNDIICNAREVDKIPTYGSWTTFLKEIQHALATSHDWQEYQVCVLNKYSHYFALLWFQHILG